MVISRLQSENKIVDLRERIKRTIDGAEQSLLRRELMVEIAMLHEHGDDDRRLIENRIEQYRSLIRATLDKSSQEALERQLEADVAKLDHLRAAR